MRAELTTGGWPAVDVATSATGRMRAIAPARRRSHILGVPVDLVARPALHERIAGAAATGERAVFLNLNVHCVMLARRDALLRAALRTVPLVFCDGAGVMLGARLLGEAAPTERFAYAEWLWDLFAFGAARGLSFYFLGGADGVAEAARARVLERHPALRIGAHHGYFDHTHGSPASRAVVQAVNAFRPSVLIVAFGMPRQERWLVEHWPELDAGVGLTGGACLDYVSGRATRPPRVLCDHGLEWLGRLIEKPGELAGRYLAENPAFVLACLRERLRWRWRRGAARSGVADAGMEAWVRDRLTTPRAAPYC